MVTDIRTLGNQVIINDVSFEMQANAVRIIPYKELPKEVEVQIQRIGDLQRFAVEWYYQNILNQNFGGRKMAPYEVVLKNY